MTRRRVVVAGAGAAGLAAAVCAAQAASERGVQASITLLEAASESNAGGNTRWSPANIRMASPHEMEAGFVDAMVAESGGRASRAYFERLAAEAPAAIAWLQSLGVKFHQPPYYLAKGPARIQPQGGGRSIVESLTRAAKAAGVELRYGSAARRLSRNARGAIDGVVLEDGGRLDAEAVVLGCGGFQGNPAMMREAFGAGAEAMRLISPGTRFDRGDGIRMALDAGARRAGDWRGMHAEPVDARSRASAPVVLVYPFGIVVDGAGRRFFDEGAGLVHETWERFARELHFSVEGRKAWVIADARLLDIADYQRAIRSDEPPVSAATPEALASALGTPALPQTLAAYNAACTGDPARFDATRKDGLAAAAALAPRKSNWARRIDRAPFLAWPVEGAVVYTFGGVDTDAEARVLGERGAIEGLYAAGEMTGHFHGTAPNAVALLRALVFGRIAGRNSIQ